MATNLVVQWYEESYGHRAEHIADMCNDRIRRAIAQARHDALTNAADRWARELGMLRKMWAAWEVEEWLRARAAEELILKVTKGTP